MAIGNHDFAVQDDCQVLQKTSPRNEPVQNVIEKIEEQVNKTLHK